MWLGTITWMETGELTSLEVWSLQAPSSTMSENHMAFMHQRVFQLLDQQLNPSTLL